MSKKFSHDAKIQENCVNSDDPNCDKHSNHLQTRQPQQSFSIIWRKNSSVPKAVQELWIESKSQNLQLMFFFTLYRVSTKLVALFYLKCLCVDMEDDLVQFWCGNGLACWREAEALVIWLIAWKWIVFLWFLLCNAFRSILLNCVYFP